MTICLQKFCDSVTDTIKQDVRAGTGECLKGAFISLCNIQLLTNLKLNQSKSTRKI